MPTKSDLDTFDLALLEILQQDNSRPLRELADSVSLSTASVQRRIKRLNQQGFITANVALVDPELVGEVITIVVEVFAVQTQLADLEALKQSFALPEIQQCYYVTGEADFILVMTVPSMSVYQALSDRLFHGNPNVKSFKTCVVLERVKATLTVPMR